MSLTSGRTRRRKRATRAATGPKKLVQGTAVAKTATGVAKRAPAGRRSVVLVGVAVAGLGAAALARWARLRAAGDDLAVATAPDGSSSESHSASTNGASEEPNESAPGHEVPDPATAGHEAPNPPADAPNESAPGNQVRTS